MGNGSKTDVVKPSNEEGNWNSMSEDSLQQVKMQFFVMFTPSSKAQAQRASQELSTVCEDSKYEIRQLVTQPEIQHVQLKTFEAAHENGTVSGEHGSARA